MPQFIVYACPEGELAEQIQLFLEKSREQVGPNAAHQYMPHCTLTGFFEDRTNTVPIYTRTLSRSLNRAMRSRPFPPVSIQGMEFRPAWHGLELDSPWLKKVMIDFACTAVSPTRKAALRLKDWLHLSLAYEFTPDQHEALMTLAQTLINPEADVIWQLRFYQRHANGSWTCYQALPLS